MPIWEQLGMQAAGNVLGLGLGLINDRRQLAQQQRLQKLEIQGSKELTDYNTAKQLQMWRNTSYPAQMEMMKKAGLNPGLMYGMGGGGGTTAQIAQGNVSGSDAPKGGGEVLGMGLMGQNAALIAAQTKLTEAQTKKTEAEATKTAGVDTKLSETQIASLSQGIKNQQAQQELTEIEAEIKAVENHIAGKTQNIQVALLQNTLQQATKNLEYLTYRNKLTETEARYKETQIKASLGSIAIDNWLKSKQGSAIDQSIRESIDRMKTAFQNRIMQSDAGLVPDASWEELYDNAFPEELKGILQALGIGLTLKKGNEKATEISGFHKRN